VAKVVPAGWYDDPASRRKVRWWNGVAWTEHVATKPGYESDDPAPPPPGPPAPGSEQSGSAPR